MMVDRLVDGGVDKRLEGDGRKETGALSSSVSKPVPAPGSCSTTIKVATAAVMASRPPLPRMPPASGHTSHAMMLQLLEYRARVRDAFQSTYCYPLALTPSTPIVGIPGSSTKMPSSPRKRDSHSGGYCRARVLESSRRLFTEETRRAAPLSPSTPSTPSRPALKGGGVAFHRSSASSRAPNPSSLFALGPGQYDISPRRPTTTGSVKFSPADRFPEHSGGGDSDLHAPGPGQYLPNDQFTAKRAARVVFSQLPRKTETAAPPRGSVTVPPATTDVVSSYYYVPPSGFSVPGDSNVPAGAGLPNWGRTARFPGQRRLRLHQSTTQTPPAVDYIARNMVSIEELSAEQRQRRRLRQDVTSTKTQQSKKQQHEKGEHSLNSACLRRRSSLFLCSPQSLEGQISVRPQRRRSSVVSVEGDTRRAVALAAKTAVSQAWSTLAVLSAAQRRLTQLLVLAVVLNRLRRAQELRYKSVTFRHWTHLRDGNVLRSLAAVLIARNTFNFRLNLRVQQKARAAQLLRQFLSGLSVDVRFTMAVRRMQRRLILLQRWWRRARLVVRAREQGLAYKWLAVEHRLRTEYVAQTPHLLRVFQPPPTASPGSPSASRRRSSATGAGGPATPSTTLTPLNKLLHLPEQSRWFTARFVLSADGVLRGYAVDGDATDSEERLVVELKHFRCHAHGSFTSAVGSSRAITEEAVEEDECEDDQAWRPFLMAFRPGASRFVLLTAASVVLTPLLDWKDKFERLATGSVFPGGGSLREISHMLVQSDAPVLVDVDGENGNMSAPSGGNHRRSSRMGLRRSQALQPIAESELRYYVVDLLRKCPRVPAPQVWSTLRDKLREKRKNFRAEIYRYQLETLRFQQHQRERQQMHVLDKFKDFFVCFRSPLSLPLGFIGADVLVLWLVDSGATAPPTLPQPHLESDDGGARPTGNQP
ncbi:hypothetical protein BBJ28_00005541 [Nothophytophthora sp. Chile5]|nr:hypothetical protein BBJ28_00005541 [Nothophytophthora sp. Chile5]